MIGKTGRGVLVVMVMALVTAGCYVGVGEKMVGFESGRFFYSDGVLKTDYKVPFDQAWTACEKVLAEMKATDVVKKKKIGTGTIDAILSDDNVRIAVEYVAKDITSVGVRVGKAGNNMASQLLQDKIKNYLAKK